ncbi:MAG: LamB/YcsF family protein, partial [Lutimonas sp.]
ARSSDLAKLIVDVLGFFKEDLMLYVPFDSQLERKAKEAGIPYAVEAFADRNYDDSFGLVPRSEPEAVLTDPKEIRSRVERMIKKKEVVSISGKVRHVNIDTICIHGDNPAAFDITRELSELIKELQ